MLLTDYLKNKITFEINKKKNKSNEPLIEEVTGKTIYLLGTPTHGNIGDQAIAYAELIFLENNFPDYNILEFTADQTFLNIEYLKRTIKKDDIVFLHGGGNLGTLYPFEELLRIEVINNLDNLIISFPQSSYFTESLFGKALLKKSKYFYDKNKRFNLVAREKYTYNFLKENFKNNLLYVPDIVFYLDNFLPTYSQNNRSGIVGMFRTDKEKLITEDEQINILKFLSEKLESPYRVSDTQLGYNKYVSPQNRLSQIINIFKQYVNAEIVVTDRLHGMIFAFLTDTPCLVLENNNLKIKGTYEAWIKPHCNFIKMIERPINYDQINVFLKEVNQNDLMKKSLSKFYKPLLNFKEIKQ